MLFYSDQYCNHCEQGFAHGDVLLNHLKKKHAYCRPCKRAFVDEEARRQHSKSIHPHKDELGVTHPSQATVAHKNILCERCKLGFESKAAFKFHQKSTPNKHFVCTSCDLDFATFVRRLEHWKTAAAHKHTYCTICSINFFDPSALTTHLRGNAYEHHLCISCNLMFADHPDLVQHWTTDEKHKALYCERCDKHFIDSTAKKTHQIDEFVKHDFCVPCSIEHKSRAELIDHWTFSTEHETLYDPRCDIHFENSTAKWIHQKATPDKHKLCQPCRLDFPKQKALIRHWKTEEVHKETYDRNCNQLFDSAIAMQKHVKETPAKHNLCEKCQVDFSSIELLKAHWKTAPVHFDTYCQDCHQDLLSPKDLEKHKQEHHPQYWCGRCSSLFPTLDLLKDHWSTSAAHLDSRCSICGEGFMTSVELNQHSFVHLPTKLPCFCCDNGDFPSYTALFAHLESGDCSSGNDMQVLNALVSECRDAQDLIMQGREPFLRAGVPRDIAYESDLNPKKNTWKCPYCKRTENLLSAMDLSRHLRAQSYLSGYPDVLKCSGCKVTFNRLSALCAHLESKSCSETMGSGPPAALLQYLSAEFSKPDTKKRLSELTYGLRTDLSQAGLLYVKVTQNIRSSSERVPPT